MRSETIAGIKAWERSQQALEQNPSSSALLLSCRGEQHSHVLYTRWSGPGAAPCSLSSYARVALRAWRHPGGGGTRLARGSVRTRGSPPPPRLEHRPLGTSADVTERHDEGFGSSISQGAGSEGDTEQLFVAFGQAWMASACAILMRAALRRVALFHTLLSACLSETAVTRARAVHTLVVDDSPAVYGHASSHARKGSTDFSALRARKPRAQCADGCAVSLHQPRTLTAADVD